MFQPYLQWKMLHEASSIREYVIQLEPATGSLVGTSDAQPLVGVHFAISLRHYLHVRNSSKEWNAQAACGCKANMAE
mgnify:CR=1 FL=1